MQFLITYLILGSFFISYVTDSLFGDVNLRQIIYHVYFTFIQGQLWFDKRHVLKILVYAAILPFVLSIIFFYLFKYFKKLNLINDKKIYSILTILFLFNISFLIYKYSIYDFFKYEKETTNIYENHYKNPPLKQNTKKNLILIYVESMENLFSKKEFFGKDLFSSIDNIDYNKYSFNKFYQKLGTSWTIAGITATQCGVPLSNFMYTKSNKFTYKVKEFMPNITCLGDILKNEGYYNVFVKSQDSRFAGTQNFLNTHGYQEIIDKVHFEDSKEISSDADSELFKYLKNKILKLEKIDKPYNLTALTFDMHHLSDNDYKNESTNSHICKNLNGKIYNDNLECVSLLVSDFINFLIKNNILDNSVLVITGDHLSMKLTPDLKKIAGSQHKRTIKNYFFSKEKYKKNRDTIYHFDLLPTILHLLDFEFKEKRFGLGASGFGELSKNFILHKIDDNRSLNKELNGFSLKYNSFWKSTK